MAVKMNLRIITKNHAADPEITLLTKSISKPNGCTTAMPTVWELIITCSLVSRLFENIIQILLKNINDNYRRFSRKLKLNRYSLYHIGENVQKWTRVFPTPRWVIIVSRTRRKKQKKIACPLLDVFACGQVSSPRLYRLRPKSEVGDILKLVCSKRFTRKYLNLKWTYESLPTAWSLKRIFRAIQ